jgi:hypothetical protein
MCSADRMMEMGHLTCRWTTSGDLGQGYARLNQEHDLSDFCLTCHVDGCGKMVEQWGKTDVREDKYRPREQVGIYRQITSWISKCQRISTVIPHLSTKIQHDEPHLVSDEA